MEITGTIHKIFEVQTFKNDFKKQEVILKTVKNQNDQYPQYIPIEFLKDNIDHVHGLEAGQEITVHINLKGREYNDKYYPSIEGWRVVNIAKESKPIVAMNDNLDNQADDLPF